MDWWESCLLIFSLSGLKLAGKFAFVPQPGADDRSNFMVLLVALGVRVGFETWGLVGLVCDVVGVTCSSFSVVNSFRD